MVLPPIQALNHNTCATMKVGLPATPLTASVRRATYERLSRVARSRSMTAWTFLRSAAA